MCQICILDSLLASITDIKNLDKAERLNNIWAMPQCFKCDTYIQENRVFHSEPKVAPSQSKCFKRTRPNSAKKICIAHYNFFQESFMFKATSMSKFKS